MASIGRKSEPVVKSQVLQRARLRASLVPEMLVEARRVVNTVMAGWHGRRRRGIGETFWQYRPYTQGETLARIDWRRSARDDQTYVRDLEWEAAHTIWLWADFSPSMFYESRTARVSKESRALVIALALADLLSQAGERVGWPGLLRPSSNRNGAERMAAALAAIDTQGSEPPPLDMMQRHSDFVVMSDFLAPLEETLGFIDKLASRGVRMHLVEIADPAEEDFPYSGRTEFEDPETGERLVAGRAEEWTTAYRDIYHARRDTLRARCQAHGGSYTVSRTDRLASETLVLLRGHFTGNPMTLRPGGGS